MGDPVVDAPVEKLVSKDVDEKIEILESASSSSQDLGFDMKATKKLIRKIDYTLLPFLALLYLLSFLDRTNIGNARLAGLEEDLGMEGLDYNVCIFLLSAQSTVADPTQVALAIFFPFYVAVEPISNLMMKRTRPSLWIPSIMVAWGLCTTLMGLVHSYAGLLVARAALGIAEGGLFPGVTFYITMWYRRHECGLRMVSMTGTIPIFHSESTL